VNALFDRLHRLGGELKGEVDADGFLDFTDATELTSVVAVVWQPARNGANTRNTCFLIAVIIPGNDPVPSTLRLPETVDRRGTTIAQTPDLRECTGLLQTAAGQGRPPARHGFIQTVGAFFAADRNHHPWGGQEIP
jgi:hypothetical protein